MGYFDVCDPTTPARFASHCKTTTGATCPATPSPYCPLGVGDLAGTGFDVWQTKVGPDGATRWLQTQAPAQPGSIITIRFAIWDAEMGSSIPRSSSTTSNGSQQVGRSRWEPRRCRSRNEEANARSVQNDESEAEGERDCCREDLDEGGVLRDSRSIGGGRRCYRNRLRQRE